MGAERLALDRRFSLAARNRSGSRASLVHLVALLIGLGGAALRTSQFLQEQTLFMDEIALALNIVDRDLWRLVAERLDHYQTAPVGFLVVQKAVVALLGSDELTLRLFPFLASVLSLLVFWQVAARVLGRAGSLIALFLFAVAPPLIVYAAQAKQYGSDVLVALLLMRLTLHEIGRPLEDRSLARSFVTGTLGALAAWFSQPAVFLLPAMGLAIVVSNVRKSGFAPPPLLRRVLPIAGLWAAGVLAVGLVALTLNPPEARAFFHAFWNDGIAFPPEQPGHRLSWAIDALVWQFHVLDYGLPVRGGWRLPATYAAIAALGLFAIARRSGAIALMLAGPLALALAAAALHLFPFRGRVILFTIPLYLLLTAAGLEVLVGFVSSRLGRAAAAVLAGLMLIAPAHALTGVTFSGRTADVSAALRYIAANWRAGDRIHVFHFAAPAVAVYAPALGFGKEHFLVGDCHAEESPRAYLRELDRYRGQRRVWLLMTHTQPWESAPILRYLETIGRARLAYTARGAYEKHSAYAVLFDLSDSERLQRADAASFPLTGRELQAHPRVAAVCVKGPSVIGRRGDIDAYGYLVKSG